MGTFKPNLPPAIQLEYRTILTALDLFDNEELGRILRAVLCDFFFVELDEEAEKECELTTTPQKVYYHQMIEYALEKLRKYNDAKKGRNGTMRSASPDFDFMRAKTDITKF